MGTWTRIRDAAAKRLWWLALPRHERAKYGRIGDSKRPVPDAAKRAADDLLSLYTSRHELEHKYDQWETLMMSPADPEAAKEATPEHFGDLLAGMAMGTQMQAIVDSLFAIPHFEIELVEGRGGEPELVWHGEPPDDPTPQGPGIGEGYRVRRVNPDGDHYRVMTSNDPATLMLAMLLVRREYDVPTSIHDDALVVQTTYEHAQDINRSLKQWAYDHGLEDKVSTRGVRAVGARRNPEYDRDYTIDDEREYLEGEGWSRVKVRKDWPETWERQIGRDWYTLERSSRGDGWHIGHSHRRGDPDSIERGATYRSAYSALPFVYGHARLPSAQRNPAHWPASEVQSLLFDVKSFTADQAKHWAKDHGYHYGKVDTTGSYHRLRQEAPHGGPCRTVEFGHGIKAIVCAAGTGRPPGVPHGK